MQNATAAFDLPPLPSYTLQPLSPLIPGLPDQYLALLLPVIAYWVVSLFFHALDHWDLFPQYRLHTPVEVLKRNHVGRWDVFRDVVVQQLIQTVVGWILTFTEEAPTFGREEYDVQVWASRIRWAQQGIPALLSMLGLDALSMAKNLDSDHAMLAGALAGGVYPKFTQSVFVSGQSVIAPAFAPWELTLGRAIYYYGVPGLQFIIAICIVDTWQYFLHRAMHMNKYLYTTFHSRHHRLYVPYAYGALYNHPFEGFLLDTLGAGIAYLVTGMTARQSMWFFTCSTIKTVDDHCGYAFPWDPLQHLTSNNAGYHDVHHQSWGIKANFSQPFFTFWDSLLGTKWTGGDVSARYERARVAAQRKVDAESKSAPPPSKAGITASNPSDSTSESLAPYEQELATASSTARAVQSTLEPRIPSGKATLQAVGGRQQVLDDCKNGGISVLLEESMEEVQAQAQKISTQRTSRKRTTSSGLKGLVDRMGDSLHGKGTGVLGVESRTR